MDLTSIAFLEINKAEEETLMMDRLVPLSVVSPKLDMMHQSFKKVNVTSASKITSQEMR